MPKKKGNEPSLRSKALSLAGEIKSLQTKTDEIKPYVTTTLIVSSATVFISSLLGYYLGALVGFGGLTCGAILDMRRAFLRMRMWHNVIELELTNELLLSEGKKTIENPLLSEQ